VKLRPKALPLQPTYKFKVPFRCWSIDYLPLLPETTHGYKHLLICVDTFSKWVELIPMRTKTSAEVAQALRLNIFARFGIPDELRMDRGLEFAGEVIALCE
jgi:Integrase core domain